MWFGKRDSPTRRPLFPLNAGTAEPVRVSPPEAVAYPLELLALISATAFPRLETIFGDNKYHNHDLQAWMATHCPTWRLEVKSRPEGSPGFTPLRQRWVVERTNAWNGRDRRNSKDYERKPKSSAVMIQISNINLILNRLSPRSCPAFRYRQKAA